MDALKADTFREFGRFNRWLVLKGMVQRPTFRVIATLRCCQAAQRGPRALRWLLLTPAKALHRLACWTAGVELPWRTAVAPGLALTHGRGMVINAAARIGSNVTLFHGVTLGQRDRIDSAGRRSTVYPVIEDDVWIGPHAIVVGVTVGKGSRIAGGAYVFEDVPPHCVVLGNPGKIVKHNCTPDVANRWEGACLDASQEHPHDASFIRAAETLAAAHAVKTAGCRSHSAGTDAAAP
jgi:serine O-acetyltransferase